MEFWIKAAQLLLSLSILVVLHELGHYIPARIFKTRVEKFYLFFDYKFSLFKKKIGETEWGIGWIPLGGYVKISGMIDESMDKEQMAKPAQPWEFRSKPTWQRLIIMLGGVTVNMLLGILIYIFMFFTWGEDKLLTNKLSNGMAIHPYMEQFGVHSGDNIIAVGDEKVEDFGDVGRFLMLRGDRTLTVVHPDGKKEVITVPETIDYDLFKELGKSKLASFRYPNSPVETIAVLGTPKSGKYATESEIASVDGKKLKDIDILNKDFRSKGHEVTFIYDGKKNTVKLDKDEFKELLINAPAFRGGLIPGDKFLSIDGKKIEYFDQISSALYAKRGKAAVATLLRDKDTITRNLGVLKSGRMGYAPKSIKPIDGMDAMKHFDYSFGESIGGGLAQGYWTLHDYVSQMKFLFTEQGVSSMGGFGAIGGLFSPTWDWHSFWGITALISIILAFMNILPIPALDGGHVVFLLYEMITGREAPEKVLEIAQYIGFFLILALVLFANGNDIYKAIFGG